jgi:GTPase Era involved in 16S rRNA processing
MWRLLIPVGGLIAKAVYDIAIEDDTPPRRKTVLELNFQRLRQELRFHTGDKIAIIGQPGSGKSSLLQKMTEGKVRPAPLIGAQTDTTNWSDNTDCNLLSFYKNYIFSDVPGYDTSSHPENIFLRLFPFEKFDKFIFVTNGKLHASDENVFRLLKLTRKKICVCRSFLDGLESNCLASIENDIREKLVIDASISILFFSNKTGAGINDINNFIAEDF